MGVTPFQTVGPFLHLGLQAGLGPVHVAPGCLPIQIEGRMFDGKGSGVPDGVLECWWADAQGQYDATAAAGFARAFTRPDGEFSVHAFRPGRVHGPDGAWQAAHLAVLVLGRGILTRYLTRIYFDDDPGLETDPILLLVPPERRSTLVARTVAEGRYHFDVVLQGDGETVFFDV